jgi:hypothetical protein
MKDICHLLALPAVACSRSLEVHYKGSVAWCPSCSPSLQVHYEASPTISWPASLEHISSYFPSSQPHSFTNMSDSSAPGCAIRSDGTLKEADEIIWHFDKDDETPMTVSNPLPTQSMHPFFTGHAVPAAIVAGSRRSNRSTRPSARVTDPNNVMNKSSPSTKAESSSSASKKRKASHPKPSRHVVQKVITDSDSEQHTDCDDNASHPTQARETGKTEIVQDEFEAIQEMADYDHQVCNRISILSFMNIILIDDLFLGDQCKDPS